MSAGWKRTMRTLSFGTGLLLYAQHVALAEDAVVLPEVQVIEKRETEAEQRAPTPAPRSTACSPAAAAVAAASRMASCPTRWPRNG